MHEVTMLPLEIILDGAEKRLKNYAEKLGYNMKYSEV